MKDYTQIKVLKSAFLSSFLEVVYTHPIDVIKTHQQNGKGFNINSTLFKGFTSRAFGVIPIRSSFWFGLSLIFSSMFLNNKSNIFW